MVEKAINICTRLRTRIFTTLLAREFYSLGKGSRIAPPFRFSNLKEISLEDNVMIHRDCWIHVLKGSDSNSPKLIIKSHAAIGMGSTISAAKEVIIEEYALLARNVYISDNRHAFEKISDPIMEQGVNEPIPVKIGKYSWLCQNVCVLPGASIGDHCVIGANSVVRTPIPDFCVAAGCPARVVRRFNPESNKWERV